MKLESMVFHTNLDEPYLPYSLNDGDHIPAIGACISVPYYGYDLELEVVAHRYRVNSNDKVTLAVELHIPKHLNMSIADWEKRLRDMRDRPFCF